MKRFLLLAALALLVVAPVQAGNTNAAMFTAQVTLTSSATQLAATSLGVYQVIIQNNAAHNMRCGDSNTTSSRGALLLASGGSVNFGPMASQSIDLAQLYCAGTSGDVVDLIYLH